MHIRLIVFLLTLHQIYCQTSETSAENDVTRAFMANGISPKYVTIAPDSLLDVNFPSGVSAHLGNELTPTQVKDQPALSWPVDSADSLYTFVMTDLDPLGMATRLLVEGRHWLVGNIPGTNIDKGETIDEFFSSGPPIGSGFHRYVQIVYKQPGRLVFDEPRLSNASLPRRYFTSVNRLAEKYNLEGPIAGNFYLCKFDAYVFVLLKKVLKPIPQEIVDAFLSYGMEI